MTIFWFAIRLRDRRPRLRLDKKNIKQIARFEKRDLRYRRYMLAASGSFLVSGSRDLMLLDPFQSVLEVYTFPKRGNMEFKQTFDITKRLGGSGRWTHLFSGNFDPSSSTTDEFGLYDVKGKVISLFDYHRFGTTDRIRLDDPGTPLRYHLLSVGFFFGSAHSSLALYSYLDQSIWFRHPKGDPDLDQVWKMPGEWSWMIAGNFVGNANDQVLFHRR